MIYTKPLKNNSGFLFDKKIGKTGETAVINYYTKQGASIIDVSEDKTFQKMDIDLIINNEFVEVKTQSSINKRQEITLELETSYYDNLYVKGWFFSTEANILIFFDRFNNIAYKIDTKELREIYNNNEKEFDIYYFDEDYKVSKLAYINITFLIKNSKTLEIINFYDFEDFDGQ